MSTKKILIIEDEQSLAHALELKLTHSGFEVRTALDGISGLELSDKETFDLILLDLIMPKMNGYEVLAQLKEKQNKTPVIVLTNLGQDEDKTRVESLGVIGFFVKSNTPLAEIVEYIEKFFSK
ncbi:MAG: response regulator [Candidatus Moraniibacteriota bacterium]